MSNLKNIVGLRGFTCFFLFFSLCKGINGQSLSLSFNSTDATNKTISVEGKSSDEVIKASLIITNNGSVDVNVKVRKIENSIVNGSQNSFCLGQCYPPSTYEAVNSFLIEKGQSSGRDVFYVEYFPNGNTGASEIKYEVFDIANPETNKVWVTITFTATFASGIGDRDGKQIFFLAYPNPVTDQWLTLRYLLPANASKGIVVITNILGVVLKSENITESQGTKTIDLSSFPNGIYFYSLVVNGKSLSSKKIIVNR